MQTEFQGREVLTSWYRDTKSENGRLHFPQFETPAMKVGIIMLQETTGIHIGNEARRSILQLPGMQRGDSSAAPSRPYFEPSDQRNLAIAFFSQPIVSGPDQARIWKKLTPLDNVPFVGNQTGIPAGDNFHVWVPISEMEAWEHFLLLEIEPTLYFWYQLTQGRVSDRVMGGTSRLGLNVSEAELLQCTTAPTITNTGDRIAVTETAAERASQREAVAAPIAAMSSAVILQVPTCTESEHAQDMNEIAGWVKELFNAGRETTTYGAADFREITLQEFISVDKEVRPTK